MQGERDLASLIIQIGAERGVPLERIVDEAATLSLPSFIDASTMRAALVDALEAQLRAKMEAEIAQLRQRLSVVAAPPTPVAAPTQPPAPAYAPAERVETPHGAGVAERPIASQPATPAAAPITPPKPPIIAPTPPDPTPTPGAVQTASEPTTEPGFAANGPADNELPIDSTIIWSTGVRKADDES
jgi:hypothetical protein